MDDDVIRTRIRAMLESGDLPCEHPETTWAGRGFGQLCAACAERIEATEVEYEVDLASGRTLRLHRQCHALWLQECETLVR
jgi:hypothetical protein